MAEDSATAAAGAAVKALMPSTIAPEVTAMIEEQTQAAVRLVAANAEGIVQAAVDKCLQGDVGALSLMLKYALPVTKTKIKLPMQPGSTIEELADNIVKSASDGQISLEDADAGLKLLERHSSVTLSGSLVTRLQALNERLMTAKNSRVIDVDVTLNRPSLGIDQYESQDDLS